MEPENWWDRLPWCERCNARETGGSHYHCGRCDHPEVTSMLGHYLNGRYVCEERGGKVQDAS